MAYNSAHGPGGGEMDGPVAMSGPCQIFLSYKNLDARGFPTRDSVLARELFDFLSSRGLSVFMSAVSLEQLGVDAYKRAIDEALDAAQVVVAIGTSRENLESKWVRYEWDSFLNDVLSGLKPQGRVFAFVEGMAPNALPRGLRQTQVFTRGPEAMARLYQFLVNSTAVVPGQPARPRATDAKPDRSSQPQARAFHERGVACYHQKHYDEAIAELSEAIRLDPTVAWAFNDRGSAWLQKGDLAKAIRDFTEGIRLDPSHAWPFHDRGTALFKSGRFSDALQDYTSALRLDPTLAWSHHDRGACHLELGALDAAIEDFTAAIRLDPDMGSAYRNRAVAYERSGQTELARADYAAARQLEPPDHEL